MIDNSVPNPTVGDNDAESPISGDEREPIPPATVPTNATTTTTKPTGALRGHQNHRPRGRPPGRARLRTSLPHGHQQEAPAREDVPGADHLVQHALNPTPPLVLAILYLWTLTHQLQVRLSPQIKHRHQNPLMLNMVCDVVVFPDIVVERVVYETVNVIT